MIPENYMLSHYSVFTRNEESWMIEGFVEEVLIEKISYKQFVIIRKLGTIHRVAIPTKEFYQTFSIHKTIPEPRPILKHSNMY